MNQRFAASIARTYVDGSIMRSGLKKILLALVVSGGLSACGYAQAAGAPDNAPPSFVQQIPSIGEQDFSILPAGGVATPVSLTQRNLPQDLPVEAVPTPTAVTSGMMVLAAMAAVRIVRRLKRA
jgi:hypothetical protein